MFGNNRISDLTGGASMLQVSGTLWKKGQRLGWVKRYMSMTTKQFTYYAKEGDSFPLFFMDTHDVNTVKEIEKHAGRRFDVIANGQMLKLMAPNEQEAEMWIKSIRAIIDTVKHSKFAVTKMQHMGNRRKLQIPLWKKNFWKENVAGQEHQGYVKEAKFGQQKLSTSSGPAAGLYRMALKKPRLMKKLLTKYCDDVQLLELMINVLLNFEDKSARDSKTRKRERRGSEGAIKPHEPVSFNLASSKSPQNSRRKHRRSRTGVSYRLNDVKSSVKTSPRYSHLTRSNSGMMTCPNEHKSENTKNETSNAWFYLDKDKTFKPLDDLKTTMHNPNDIRLFKTYLKALYQDENVLFLCDAANFDQKKSRDGKALETEEALQTEGWRIFDKYIKVDAEMSVEVAERERRKIRGMLTAADPTKAFEPVVKRLWENVEEQFNLYKESEFYRRISASCGPILERDLAQMFEDGKVTGETMVWKDGTKLSNWKKANMVSVFRDALFDRQSKGNLSQDEMEYIFKWIEQLTGSLEMIQEGMVSSDVQVRTLSYRVLLLALRATMGYNEVETHVISKSFTDLVRNTIAAKKDSIPINQVIEDHFTLMTMLFNPVEKFNVDFDGKTVLKPGRIVHNDCVWPSILDNLFGSNVYPRVKCLQDVYYHILTEKKSAQSLLSVPNWQAWFLPLVFDIPPTNQTGIVGNTKTYVIAIIVQLLWTSVEHMDWVDFAKELRLTIGMTLSVCGEYSGSLVAEFLSATAFRFQSDVLKWAKLDPEDQIKRFKCLYHMLRLMIAMALNISSRRFGIADHLRTHKILPKEIPEKHHMKKDEKKRVYKSQGAAAQYEGHLHREDATRTLSTSRRARTATQSEEDDDTYKKKVRSTTTEPNSTMGSFITPNGEEKTNMDISNDQQILYVCKVYIHSQESQYRHHSSDVISSSLNLNHYVLSKNGRFSSNLDVHGTDDVADLGLENMRFVLSATDIISLYKRRIEDLKKSLDAFGDSDHIFSDANNKSSIRLSVYNSSWHLSLRGFVDSLSKIQTLLLNLKQQESQMMANLISIDTKVKKVRHEVLNMLSFVNDTIGFLDLLDRRLWRLLNIKQVSDLVRQFVETSDPIRRRKIFHGWEKEKKKNQAMQTKKLERKLKDEEERRSRTHTLLLIGPGQSGKSTVFKQLTILHGRGFSERKIRQYRKQIYTNIVGAMKNMVYHSRAMVARTDESLGDMEDDVSVMHEILDYLRKEGKEIEAKKAVEHIRKLKEIVGLNERYRAYLLEAARDEHKLRQALDVKKSIKRAKVKCAKFVEVELPKMSKEFFDSFKLSPDTKDAQMTVFDAPHQDVEMNPALASALKLLWKDKAIRNIFGRRQLFKKHQLDDSAVYMLAHMDRILSEKNYMPTQRDIVNCRQRTLGIVEGEFEINGQIFKIVDVAGQRGARSKWIPLFSTANACLFVCSLVGYNRYLIEDKEKLRIFDALDLFEDVANQQTLSKLPLILFLNKVDLFEKEIQHTSLQRAFPQYRGVPDSLQDSIAFLKKRFMKCVKDPHRFVFIHTTCATDQGQLLKILDSVTDTIVKRHLSAAGLV